MVTSEWLGVIESSKVKRGPSARKHATRMSAPKRVASAPRMRTGDATSIGGRPAYGEAVWDGQRIEDMRCAPGIKGKASDVVARMSSTVPVHTIIYVRVSD